MSLVVVPNRPFGADLVTGVMLPDGIFVTSLGKQRLAAQFRTPGAAPQNNVSLYVESVSDPGIVITPRVHFVSKLGGVARLVHWEADFGAASPGVHRVSFIAQSGAARRRIIKKIFVIRLSFNPTTKTFTAEVPEGTMSVRLADLVAPRDRCCHPRRRDIEAARGRGLPLPLRGDVRALVESLDFQWCPPGYLPHIAEVVVTSAQPFPGQYGDLPFKDPWWKIIFVLLSIIWSVLAGYFGAQEGDDITTGVSADMRDEPPPRGIDDSAPECCEAVESIPQGETSSALVAWLSVSATASWIATALADVKDPFRRGQDNTVPAAGELTTSEKVVAVFSYPEAIRSGRPFATGVSWSYRRQTTGETYRYGVDDDVNTNVHVASTYTVTAPNVVRLYREEPFVIKAEFFGPDGGSFRGDQLYVQCILRGPQNQYRTLLMQDDGLPPDEKAGDGIYTGVFQFALEAQPRGLWMIYVLAQDINTAQPDMTPEQQAQIIGGMLLTHQVTIDFHGGTCPLVPDGHVNVV